MKHGATKMPRHATERRHWPFPRAAIHLNDRNSQLFQPFRIGVAVPATKDLPGVSQSRRLAYLHTEVRKEALESGICLGVVQLPSSNWAPTPAILKLHLPTDGSGDES